MFTNKDIETMSNGIIELIQNASKAKKLVHDELTRTSIDRYIKELQELNTRLAHTKTIEYEGFIIECFEEPVRGCISYVAYLSHPDYGVKKFMFGLSPEQTSFDGFIEVVENSIDEYIEIYKEDYFD